MGCISKFTLFVTNFIVFGVGVAVVVLASLIISKDGTYGDLLADGVFSLPIVILIAGLLIVLIGFLGCCGAMRENKCMLYLYAIIVLIFLLAEFIMGIMMLVYANQIESYITEGMEDVFKGYGGKDTALTKSLDDAQHAIECCGVWNYTDWRTLYKGHNDSVADGCCIDEKTGCGIGMLNKENVTDLIYTKGCFYAIKDDVQDAGIGLGVACLILALVEAISIFFACSLAKEA